MTLNRNSSRAVVRTHTSKSRAQRSAAPASEWADDRQLFALIRSSLYTAVIGDILDQLGRYHQFLPPTIRPLLGDMRLAGRAMPVLQADVYGPRKVPFGLMTRALDDLRAGDIYLSTGGTHTCANWGELMTAAARTHGAVGAVVNGWHRDTPQVLSQSWPVFSRGAWAQDSAPRMQVVDFRCRIEIEGAVIADGDLVVGDCDGVVVVPRELETEVIRRALDKARAEKVVRKAIEAGMTTTDAFKKYGIL